MKVQRFEWRGPFETARAARVWFEQSPEREWVGTPVTEIDREIAKEGDEALLRLTERFDKIALTRKQLKVDDGEARAALKTMDSSLRKSLELAAANIRAVAESQINEDRISVELAQGQIVTVREVPVASAGIYAPGGRAAYPSSVLMCAIPAQVAGVERIALASPPGPDARPSSLILAAASLCGIEEIYAVGGAQAIFSLARGTECIPQVDVIAGPGNRWVQEAKRRAYGRVGIDSFAGPSELLLIAGRDTNPRWAAADLCAQAEHGADSPLLAAAVERSVLDAIAEQVAVIAKERGAFENSRLALIQAPDLGDAIALANVFSPEHLELMGEDAALHADQVTTSGCVFTGRYGATAFGDYAVGSNHVLPTARSGRFAGPLSPGTFRRKISTVEISAEAAAKLAPHVDRIARAEGFPVHGESAMIRTEP